MTGSQHPQPQPYPQQPYPPQQWGPPPKRRKVWPWVLLAAVMIPILGFVACAALVGTAVNQVEENRQGGTVAIGETFTYKSGLAITVAQPTPYDADNEFIVSDKETGYEATVTVVNGTDKSVGAVLISINATVNSAPAQQIFTDNAIPTQDIAPGQKLAIPFRFKVPAGTTGPMQIAVTDTFNEPIFFTGQL